MIKYLILFLFTLFLLGCSNSNKSQKIADTPIIKKNINKEFQIIDSGVYWDELDGGNFQIIKLDDLNIDTVDSDFGIHKLTNGAIVYLKVHKQNSEEFHSTKDSIYGSIGDYFLLKDSEKTSIETIVPYFNYYFSSPTLIEDDLYYWGMNMLDTTTYLYKIYATKYNLITNKKTTKLLFEDGVETDFRGHFPTPYLKNDKIIFQLDENQKWFFSKEFKIEN